MRRPVLIAVLLGLTLSPAVAQEPPVGQEPARTAASDALINKFLSCYAEEADVTAEDRATIKQFAGDLAEGLANVLSAGSEAAGIDLKGPAGPKAEKVLDPVKIAGYACKDLASKLEEAMTGGGLDKLLGDSPAEQWAKEYTAEISKKVLECYAVEIKRAVSGEEKARLTQFNGRMARMVSLLTSTGACTIEMSKKQNCFQGIQQLVCEDISKALGTDAGQLIKALGPACSSYINCGIEAAIEKELR